MGVGGSEGVGGGGGGHTSTFRRKGVEICMCTKDLDFH